MTYNLSDEEILNTFLSTKNIDIKLDIISTTKSPSMFRKLYKGSDDLLIRKEIIKICQDDVVYAMALKEPSLKIDAIRAVYNNVKNSKCEIPKIDQDKVEIHSRQTPPQTKKPQRKYLSNLPQKPQKTQSQISIKDLDIKRRTIADLDKF